MNVNVNVPGLSGTGVWGAATGPGRGLVGWDVRVGWWVWMVVRFVCVIRVIRARVSRVCPGSPQCLFTFAGRCTPFPVHQSFIRHEAAAVYTSPQSARE